MLEEYITIRESEQPPNSAQIGRAKSHLGRTLLLMGARADACDQLSAALPLVVEARGEEHLHVANAAFWLASCRAAQGLEQEAATLYDRTIAIRTALSGSDGLDLQFTNACILAQRGDRDGARNLLRELADAGYVNTLAGHYPHFADPARDAEIDASPGACQ